MVTIILTIFFYRALPGRAKLVFSSSISEAILDPAVNCKVDSKLMVEFTVDMVDGSITVEIEF